MSQQSPNRQQPDNILSFAQWLHSNVQRLGHTSDQSSSPALYERVKLIADQIDEENGAAAPASTA